MDEEEKVSALGVGEDPQSICDSVLNVLLVGTSGSGKSSIINYLARTPLAPVGDSGSSCTKNNISYEVTLLDRKLRIFDTQGFNDTAGFINGTVASRIKS
jgi:predicted GTPase